MEGELLTAAARALPLGIKPKLFQRQIKGWGEY
jgi:hypothetical protein